MSRLNVVLKSVMAIVLAVGLCPMTPCQAQAQEDEAGSRLVGAQMSAADDETPSVANAHVVLNYNAFASTPATDLVDAVLLSGVPLVKGRDFTVWYRNTATGNTFQYPDVPNEAGSYAITIVGLSPYGGEYRDSGLLVRDPSDLANATAMVAGKVVVRAGEAITPDPLVMINDEVLETGRDYSVSYLDENGTSLPAITVAGTYKAVVEGVQGSAYEGTTITSYDFDVYDYNSLKSCSIVCASSSMNATGQVLHPDVRVVSSDGKALVEGDDYGLAYTRSGETAPCDIVEPGQYAVHVTGKNGWHGAVTHYVSVNDPHDIGNASCTLPYRRACTYSRADFQCDVVLDGKVLVENVDYTISITGDAGINPDAPSPGSYKLLFTGKGSYTGSFETRMELVDAKSLELAAIDYQSWFAYTGDPISMNPIVTLDGNQLVQGRDYEITYSQFYSGEWTSEPPAKCADYYAKITALNGYKDSVTLSFAIVDPHDLQYAQLSGVEASYEYTGQPIKPVPVVTACDGTVLQRDKDYSISWAPTSKQSFAGVDGTCIHEGQYAITVKGKGDYYRDNGAYYSVLGSADVPATAQIVGLDAVYAYTGSPIDLGFKVVRGDAELVEGADYATVFDYENGASSMTFHSAGQVVLPGTYVMHIYPETTSNFEPLEATFEVAEKAADEVSTWKRLSGEHRYLTMRAIVKEGFQSSPVAVVATGAAFPDALSASALAGAYDAPVILTGKDALSAEASKELNRLGVKRVFLMGGENAVSANVEKELKRKGISVVRVSGSTRIDTSVETYKRVKDSGSYSGTVVLATSENYADALSIGPWSYAACSPILLVKGNSLSKDVAAAVADAKSVIIVGGTNAVSDAIARQLKTLCKGKILRLSGDDRYLTSAAIAKWEIDQGMTCASPAIATGKNFPDALAGAALCGKNNSVLLLADKANDSTVSFVAEHKGAVKRGYLLGGKSVVSDGLADAVANATGYDAAVRQARAALAAAQADKNAADAALSSATAKEAASARDLADASATKTAAEDAFADALAGKQAADADLAVAQRTYDVAKAAYDAAAGEKSEKQSAYDDAIAEKNSAQDALDAATSALEAANAALEAAKVPSVTDPAAIAAAQTVLDEANSTLEAAAAVVAKGSVGFFESRDEQTAIDALTKCTYASYTKLGEAGDATSLENMKLALDIIEMCNMIRNSHGFNSLYVSDYMMAISQANANYSGKEGVHARQFEDVSENIARNNDDDPQHGAIGAFAQWYQIEKQNYDNAVSAVPNGGSYTFNYNNTSYTVNLPDGWTKWSAYELLTNVPDFYNTVGHYMNVINPDYTATGAAYCVGTGWKNAYVQDFQLTIVGNFIDSERVEFANYKTSFMTYYNKVMGDLAAAQQAVADAQAALEAAQNNKTVDADTVAAAEAAVADAQANHVAAQSAYDSALAVANAAQGDLASATQALDAATAQLESAQGNLGAKTAAAANQNAILNVAQKGLTSSTNAYDKAKGAHDAAVAAKEAAIADQAIKAFALADAQAALDALLS